MIADFGVKTVRLWILWPFRPLKNKTLGCPETSESDYPVTRRHLPEKRNPQPQPFETSTLEHELRLDGGIVLCDVTRCTVFLVADGGSEWFATVYQTARHITPGVKKKFTSVGTSNLGSYYKWWRLLLTQPPHWSLELEFMYVVGSKSFRPDIQKPRQMENAVWDI